jgi:pteridine reductase
VVARDAQVALVTGAGRRLGRAIAAGLAADGLRIAAHYHESEAGVESFLAEHGSPHVAVRANLLDPGEAAALPASVVEQFGRLDVVVNSAAVLLHQPVGSVAAADWDRVLDLNLRAPFLVTQAAAPALRASRGCVVNIADVSGLDPWPSYLPHAASKAGLLALTRGFAQALAPDVRVNAIVPGAVLPPDGASDETRRRAADRALLGRIGDPQDVVDAVRFLWGSQFVTGTTLVIDGGALARARADG